MPLRSRLFRILALMTLVGVLPLLATAAAAETGSSETFEGAADVVLVEVPVRVVLEDSPLIGLTADDFEVYDRGDRREITHFEVLDFRRPEEGAGGSDLAPSGARSFLFVVDLAYPARAGRSYSRSILSAMRNLHLNIRSLARFLSSSLGPSDRWALAYHSPLRGVRLLQAWTSDPAAIEPTVELLDAIALAKPKRVEQALEQWQGSRAVVGDLPEALLLTSDDLVAEARTASVRADPFLPQLTTVQNLIDGLIELTGAIGEVAGPRHLIYLSGGFPLSEDGTSAPILKRLQQLFRDFRSSGWSVEAVNPTGTDLGGGSLFMIAHETGGQLHTNSRELTELLDRMEAHTAYSYVLGFNPVELEADGRYHRLKVKLVDAPGSARVVHRRGYYAPESDEKRSSSERPGATR